MASKQKKNSEAQVLNLLKEVLVKAVTDPKLADKIYTACEQEIVAKTKVAAFEKYCQRCELPNLETETVQEVQRQFEQSFGEGKVSLVPEPEEQTVRVEIETPTEMIKGVIKVNPNANPEAAAEEEEKPKMVPFPVCLEGDPELIWMLARFEKMTPDEASVALAKAQENFWESKSGQKLLRDRVDRTFPEFMVRVPSKFLTEVGLKRHYKDPEPVKQLRLLKAK